MDIKKILELHSLWLEDNTKGERANLLGVNLKGANLTEANLLEADLKRANLTGTNLKEVFLANANPSEASLEGSNLCDTCIYSFSLGKYPVYVWTNLQGEKIVKIGCEEHTLTHWFKNYKEIGEANEYTKEQITLHLKQLKVFSTEDTI